MYPPLGSDFSSLIRANIHCRILCLNFQKPDRIQILKDHFTLYFDYSTQFNYCSSSWFLAFAYRRARMSSPQLKFDNCFIVFCLLPQKLRQFVQALVYHNFLAIFQTIHLSKCLFDCDHLLLQSLNRSIYHFTNSLHTLSFTDLQHY